MKIEMMKMIQNQPMKQNKPHPIKKDFKENFKTSLEDRKAETKETKTEKKEKSGKVDSQESEELEVEEKLETTKEVEEKTKLKEEVLEEEVSDEIMALMMELLNLTEEEVELIESVKIVDQELIIDFKILESDSEESLGTVLESLNEKLSNMVEKLNLQISEDYGKSFKLDFKSIDTKEGLSFEEAELIEKIVNVSNEIEEDELEGGSVKEASEGVKLKVDKKAEKSMNREADSENSDSDESKLEAMSNVNNNPEIKITRNENQFNLGEEIIARPDTSVEIGEEEVIGQIVEKMDLNILEEKNEVVISLKPETMGKVFMNLEVTRENLTAKIMVENYKTKHAIQNNLEVLEKELHDSGMEIKSFEVFVGNNSDFDRHDQSQNLFNQNKKFNFGRHNMKKIAKISDDYEVGTVASSQNTIDTVDGTMDMRA